MEFIVGGRKIMVKIAIAGPKKLVSTRCFKFNFGLQGNRENKEEKEQLGTYPTHFQKSPRNMRRDAYKIQRNFS